jgi:hypothetical protein
VKIKKHIEKLKQAGKLKIDHRRRNWYGDYLYFYKDEKGKEVIYNLTYDLLEKYDKEHWIY